MGSCDGDASRCFVSGNGNFKLTWGAPVGGNVRFTASALSADGLAEWVGVGFNPTRPTMAGSDMYMGELGSGVTDSYSTTYFIPTPDTVSGGGNDVITSSCLYTPHGALTCTFTRPLSPRDANGIDADLANPQHLLWAFGTSPLAAGRAAYHGSNRGATPSLISFGGVDVIDVVNVSDDVDDVDDVVDGGVVAGVVDGV